jgi:chromosome partitioning protein
MTDTRSALNVQVVAEIRNMFRERVFDVMIPRNVRLAEAPSHGVPITIYDPRSKGAEAYQQLSLEIIKKAGYA